MAEQRARVRSSDITERFAAALLIPGVLAKRLRERGEQEPRGVNSRLSRECL
jgi:hypothetical protein